MFSLLYCYKFACLLLRLSTSFCGCKINLFFKLFLNFWNLLFLMHHDVKKDSSKFAFDWLKDWLYCLFIHWWLILLFNLFFMVSIVIHTWIRLFGFKVLKLTSRNLNKNLTCRNLHAIRVQNSSCTVFLTRRNVKKPSVSDLSDPN